MEVYALYEELNNNEYRWNTILRFGESWDPIGTVVMKNPGSAAPQEKVSDELSEILNQNFCGQQYAQHTWYHFSPDITMKCIERLFRGYYGEKMSGVIRIFNLCNLISPDYKKLLNKLKNTDEIDSSLVYTGTFDITQMSAPIYIGWGKAWKKDFKDNYKPYFEKAIAEDNTILDKHVEVNPFFHPLYLMNYGASKSNDIRERFVESIVLNIAKQFINDPAGDYKYLGELEVGKHFVEYMFTGDYVEDDIMLCVGTKRFLVVEANVCRWAEVDEEVLAMDFVMAKENIEKSYNFGASEFNREAKRLAQERLKQGLPVSVDIPNDADAEDLAMLNAFDKWLRDGQPVE